MKKYLLILFLIIFIAPSVALASWWNPFTWNWPWTKQAPVVDVVPTIAELPKEPTTPVVTPTVKTEEKKTPTPTKPVVPVVTTPVYTPPPVPIVVTPPVTVVELSISNISVDEESNSARVSWKTSITSESKVILEGKSYFSKRGVGTEHYADVDGLESDLLYGGTITAIANNAWKSENFKFTTKLSPLKITMTKQYCPTESCTFSWETNYKTDSGIKIYKQNSTTLVESENSSSKNSKAHTVNFTLQKNTYYNFEIYATSDTDSAKSTGTLQTHEECKPSGLYSCLNVSA